MLFSLACSVPLGLQCAPGARSVAGLPFGGFARSSADLVVRRAPPPGMEVKQSTITMPALSSTMTEGKISSWLMGVGDKVDAGDMVLVVESDKADMDVESYEEGYIAKILVGEGEASAHPRPNAPSSPARMRSSPLLRRSRAARRRFCHRRRRRHRHRFSSRR